MTSDLGQATRPTRARPSSRPQVPEPALIAGAGSVALLLFGTRWGSYLGFGGVVFLSDLLMAGAVLLTVLRSIRGGRPLVGGARPAAVPWALWLAGGYSVLRFLLGGDWSLIAIRDAAPYVYILVGLLSFYAVRRAAPGERRRTQRLLLAALVLHALWFTVQLAVPSLPDALPTVSAVQGLHVFSPRPDVDTTLIGVLAAWLLWRLLRYRRAVPGLLLAYAACWIPIGLSTTRAGVLGSLACSAWVLLLALTDRRRRSLDRGAVAVVTVVALLAGGGLILTSSVGAKFVATVLPSTADSSAAAEGGAGTARARSQAWNRLVEWTFEDPARAFEGVGFGPDFLVDSGASALLVHSEAGGDTVPRSPHDYWLGSMARLGVVGLVLLVVLVLQVLLVVGRLRRPARDDGLIVVVGSTFIALIIPASLGVVLESPFGAVPFWWCAGVLLGLATLRDPDSAAGAEAALRGRRPVRSALSASRNAIGAHSQESTA